MPLLKGVTMSVRSNTFASLLGLSVTCGFAGAQEMLTVPLDHPTIQSAIDALPPGGPANIIRVAPGLYEENLVISDRTILFVGDPQKPTSVTIDGMGTGSVASLLDDAHVAFSGLSFQNGVGTVRAGSSRGGGIYAQVGTSLIMGDCLIQSNEALYGGGIYASGVDQVELTRVHLRENHGGSGGGGALIYGPFEIRDSMFVSNRSSIGGHLECSASSSATRLIEACEFVDGVVTRSERFGPSDEASGGAIHASITQGSALVVRDCRFEACNSTDVGGAISCRQPWENLRQRCLEGTYVCGRGTLQLEDCSFTQCAAPRGGAITWSYEEGLEIARCVFDSCLALSGGAILADAGEHRIVDSSFTQCTAIGQSGGGLWLASCRAELDGTEFVECAATNSSGGAIHALEAQVDTSSCGFTANTAETGSAICARRSSLFDQDSLFERNDQAYAIALESEDQVRGSEFIGTEFRDHGQVEGSPAHGAVRMSFHGPAEGPQSRGRFVGCTFSSNLSNEGAAGIESVGMEVEVKTSTFIANGALAGEPADFNTGLGGAINVQDARADIWTARFERNFAEDSGGAIAAKNAQLMVWECEFHENAATRYGGSIETHDGTMVSITDSRFVASPEEDGPLGEWNARSGGAIDIAPGSGPAYLGGILVEGHAAVDQGGGIWTRGEQTTIEDCLVRNNHSGFGGGAYLDANGSVKGTRFCGNSLDQLNGHEDWIDAGGNVFAERCCPADLDGDGLVNGQDLSALLASFGSRGASSLLFDLNGDALVDGADLTILLSEWGAPCGM